MKESIREGLIQLASGGTAGFLEVCIMQPLDIVKTRMQLQGKLKIDSNDPFYYTGIWDCLKKMHKHEGLVSYWKGILPPILVETPKRATKFFVFEHFKQLYMFGAPSPTPLTYSLSGLSAGIIESILVNPFEMVKVNLQVNKSNSKVTPSTLDVTKDIIKKHGLIGLNKGLTATLCRNSTFNMIYFGFYHSVKGLVPILDNPYQEFVRKFTIGFMSGTLGAACNIPFDVAKSRIQAPQIIHNKYKSVFQTMGIVYREEGLGALYKGFLPKILRLGPGGAILLLSYEFISDFLHSL